MALIESILEEDYSWRGTSGGWQAIQTCFGYRSNKVWGYIQSSSLIHIKYLYTKLADQIQDTTNLLLTNHTHSTSWIQYFCCHSWQSLDTIKNSLQRRIFEFKKQEIVKTAYWGSPFSSQSTTSVTRSRLIMCAGEDTRAESKCGWTVWFRRESNAKPL